MGEVCDSPIQREVRYDRQLRLWGEHGQSALEKASILVCGVNTTTCELTKNLILPGVGRVILADPETVTQTDLLSNFFYLPDAVGKSKAESVYSQLSTWRRDNDNKFPSSYKEKVQVRQLFEKMRRTPDEENFNEGAKAVLKLLTKTQVPTNVKEILQSPKIMNLSPSTNIFWFLARALHDYLNDPLSEGLLPLRPNLPDMTADSASYVELTKIYRDRAARDLDRFRSILSDLCQASQIEMPDYSTITNFCNNIPNMKVMNQNGDSDADYDDLLQDPEALCILNLVFDAFLKFKQENCRFPGDCDDSELESDKQNILSSINRNIAEPYVEELLRSAGLELHSIASYLGGISAQEVIKILTSQYVPIDNCLFYDGIRQQLQVQKF